MEIFDLGKKYKNNLEFECVLLKFSLKSFWVNFWFKEKIYEKVYGNVWIWFMEVWL